MRKGLWVFASAGVMALTACTSVAAEPTPPEASSAPMIAPPTPSATSNAVVENKDYFEFSYSWPKEASAHPKLLDFFQTDAAQNKAELQAAYDEDDRLKDPKDEYKPTYAFETTWTLDAQTAHLISLSGGWYQYMGGAHGMYGVRALVFDTATQELVLAQDMLADADGFVAATRDEFCRLLDQERETRRREPVDRSDMFGECINLLDQTLIWKSSGGGKFDRLEVFIGPYEAGPYAEGAYVLNLPITAPMLAAIAPRYADNFAASAGNAFVVEDE